MSGFCLIGKWMVPAEELHKPCPTADAWFFASMPGTSPLVKFTNGVPAMGDAVRVNCHWDTCENRGPSGDDPKDRYRPLLKLVIRVKRIENLRNDTEIHFATTGDRLLDNAEFRPLRPLLLTNQNTHALEPESRWLIAVSEANKPLAESIRTLDATINLFMPSPRPPRPPWLGLSAKDFELENQE